MYYTEDLLKKLIEEPSENNDELIIISGYGSARFLSDIHEKFPAIKITLILGMAAQGISNIDYEGYRELTLNSQNINVRFQTIEPLTHMKVYQWKRMGEPTQCFIGSANFSYSGFLKNNEIMSTIDNDCLELIKKYYDLSIDCLDNKIQAKLKLFDKPISEVLETEKLGVVSTYKTIDRENLIFPQLKRYYYDELYTDVTLTFNNGLNRGLRNKLNSYLDIDKNLEFFDRYLPIGFQGTIELDGLRLKIERDSKSGRRLRILHDYYNFYNITLAILGLDITDTIDYAALISNELYLLKFIHVGDNHFKIGI